MLPSLGIILEGEIQEPVWYGGLTIPGSNRTPTPALREPRVLHFTNYPAISSE
jgi:hypothetical protein